MDRLINKLNLHGIFSNPLHEADDSKIQRQLAGEIAEWDQHQEDDSNRIKKMEKSGEFEGHKVLT